MRLSSGFARRTKGAPVRGRPSSVPGGFVEGILGRGAVPELSDADVAPALEVLRRHRLEGLARVRGVGRSEPPSGPLGGPLGGPLDRGLEAAYRRYQLTTPLALDAARRAAALLAGVGVSVLLFKGAGLVAAGLYRDPGARPMDDADLLVHPEDAARAATCLEGAGFRPWRPWRAGQEEWSDSFSFSDPSAPPGLPVALDLHWRTDYGRLRFGHDGEESLLWNGAGLDVHLPAPEAHLVVIAEHVLKHLRVKPHLLAYADLVRVSEAVSDWGRVAEALEGRSFATATRCLLRILREDLGAPVPGGVTEDVDGRAAAPSLAGRLRPAALLGEPEERIGRLAGLRLRRTLIADDRRWLEDLVSAAVPDARWLRARYGNGSPARLWGRHAHACLRWLRGCGPSPASPNQV